MAIPDYDANPVQGEPANNVVELRFSSTQAVRAFERDPRYQPVNIDLKGPE